MPFKSMKGIKKRNGKENTMESVDSKNENVVCRCKRSSWT
jgi:hypothetical protein